MGIWMWRPNLIVEKEPDLEDPKYRSCCGNCLIKPCFITLLTLKTLVYVCAAWPLGCFVIPAWVALCTKRPSYIQLYGCVHFLIAIIFTATIADFIADYSSYDFRYVVEKQYGLDIALILGIFVTFSCLDLSVAYKYYTYLRDRQIWIEQQGGVILVAKSKDEATGCEEIDGHHRCEGGLRSSRVVCCLHGKLCCQGRDEKRHPSRVTPISRRSRGSLSTVNVSLQRPQSQCALQIVSLTPKKPLATYTYFIRNDDEKQESQKVAQGAYVGVLDALSAEGFISRPTSFVLYHKQQHSDDEIREAIKASNENYLKTGMYKQEDFDAFLTLHIAYRTLDGRAVHFPIVVEDREGAIAQQRMYSIGCAPASHHFLTIAGLVRFYTTFTCDNKMDSDGISGEVFPIDLFDSFISNFDKESFKKTSHK
ncbi:unnamed protein product, partial [Mesorhabditis belari]|uniref:Uncharacterized protein n=1 Tax=Mesorhabditis belari TaxID=2138241 RepID=A0AAF3EWP8_9BILA